MVTFVQIAGGAAYSSPSVTLATTPLQNNLLIGGIAIYSGGDGSSLMPSGPGWTGLSSAGTGSTSLNMFWKFAGPTEPSTVTVPVGAQGAMFVAEYVGNQGVLPASAASDCTNYFEAETPVVTPSGSGAALVVCLLTDFAGSASSPQVNGSPVTQRYASSFGSGFSTNICVAELSVLSLGGSYQGTATTRSGNQGSSIAVFTGFASARRASMML